MLGTASRSVGVWYLERMKSQVVVSRCPTPLQDNSASFAAQTGKYACKDICKRDYGGFWEEIGAATSINTPK